MMPILVKGDDVRSGMSKVIRKLLWIKFWFYSALRWISGLNVKKLVALCINN